MDNGGVGDAGAPIDGGDWRARLLPDSRDRIANKLMGTFERHVPVSGPEELWNIAVWFEEEIYTAAINEADYVRKIGLLMLTVEAMAQEDHA